MSEKKPFLFYYENAVNCWTPVIDSGDSMVDVTSLADGEKTEIAFKRIDMTQEEFDNLPEV